MFKKFTFLFAILLSIELFAQNIESIFSYQKIDFKNSKRKNRGDRYGVGLKTANKEYGFKILFEKTKTDTFKPPLKKDLEVDKYFIKLTKKLNKQNTLSFNFALIEDNLMKQTDRGKIYGLGYSYKNLFLTQYFSDYKRFDVFQTDLKFSLKKDFFDIKTAFIIISKYIKLYDKNSNRFSKNAKNSYFTSGIKIHSKYKSYHFGMGAFLGKRVFAIMQDGFKVQHHAMEFKKTYMCGVGRSFKWGDINLKYIYQKAKELPINNDNVTVKNISLNIVYRF